MTDADGAASLTVGLPRGSSPFLVEQRSVLASLPELFAVTQAPEPDVVVVEPGADWPAAVRALTERVRVAIAVPLPVPVDPNQIEGLGRGSDGAEIIAIVLHRHGSDPTWAMAAEELAVAADTAVSISLLATVLPDGVDGQPVADALGTAVLDQIALLTSLIPDLTLTSARAGAHHYVATGSGGVTLSAVMSAGAPPGLELDVVGTAERWAVRFDDRAIATPTRVERYDLTGRAASPLRWESGLRAGWRAAHDRITTRRGTSQDLSDLARHTRIAAPVLAQLDQAMSADPQIGES